MNRLQEGIYPEATSIETHNPAMGLEDWTRATEAAIQLWLGLQYEGTALKDLHPETEQHQKNVAGLTGAFLARVGRLDPRLNMTSTLAARHHDMGKIDVLDLVMSKEYFNPEQRDRMSNHPAYGATAFRGLLDDLGWKPQYTSGSIIDAATFMIANHHGDLSNADADSLFMSDIDTGELLEATAVLQIADRLEAMLTPTGRAYRAKRMASEELADVVFDDQGKLQYFAPRVPKIVRCIEQGVGFDGRLEKLKVNTRELIEIGVLLMQGEAVRIGPGEGYETPGIGTYGDLGRASLLGTLDGRVPAGVI